MKGILVAVGAIGIGVLLPSIALGQQPPNRPASVEAKQATPLMSTSPILAQRAQRAKKMWNAGLAAVGRSSSLWPPQFVASCPHYGCPLILVT
jgi:hypothetical protein